MFDRTAILLLASGLSSRFGAGDKLMANLNGRPILARAAGALANRPVAKRVAVVGKDQTARKACLEALGFEIVLNPAPEDGQGRTLAIGSQYVRDATEADSVLILLGDMPFVTDTHLAGIPARHVVAAAPDLLMDIDDGLDLQRAEEQLNG